MPRKPRIISSTNTYHIILRSVNQHIIFEDAEDYQKFLLILYDCKLTFDVEIYAYCLMDNHVHLLLCVSKDNLSSFFQSFETRFVRWYNSKYSRSGHLFQDRFFSVAIETTAQYLATLAYIHNNPVRAFICRFPSEYHWSSFKAFYGEKNPLVNPDHSYEIAGSKDSLIEYFASVNSSSELSNPSTPDQSTRHFIPDKKALSIFKSVTHLASTSDVIALTKHDRNEYIRALCQKGLTQKQVSRLMDVSISTVKRAVKMSH